MTIDINLTLRADDSLRSLLAAFLNRPAAPEAPVPVAPKAPAAVSAAPQANPAPVIPTATPTVPAAPAPADPPPAPVPTATVPTAPAPGYTLDQLSRAGAALASSDPAKRNQLIALLQQFGIQTISQLPPEEYGAFATALRGLGAAI